MWSVALSLGAIWGQVWPFLLAILFFGFLIFSHELGHFGAARAFGMTVFEFSLGMGKRLWQHKSKKGTIYSLKAVPFGGSVLLGEDDEPSEDPHLCVNQAAHRRFVVFAAGALVNLLCGVLIMAIIAVFTPAVARPQVMGFAPKNAVSNQAGGLQTGDHILKINGKRVLTSADVGFLLARKPAKSGHSITVRRASKIVQLENVHFPVEKTDGKDYASRDFYFALYSNNSYYKKNAANLAGGKNASLVVGESLRQSVSAVRMIWLSLLDIVRGKFSLREMSGPIGVVKILGQSAGEVRDATQPPEPQKDPAEQKVAVLLALEGLLSLFGLISLNIGIMNLLPLPALDGGRLLFCTAEMLFRKPVPKKLEGYVHMVGFAVLMLFMLVVSFSDIWALIRH